MAGKKRIIEATSPIKLNERPARMLGNQRERVRGKPLQGVPKLRQAGIAHRNRDISKKSRIPRALNRCSSKHFSELPLG
jgi:hypothetical protein